jgi:hypothetical protein
MARKEEPSDGSVMVLLLGDHVYLPQDPKAEGWETAGDTARVEGKVDGRRTRIACHPTLAKFLQERAQAEILD